MSAALFWPMLVRAGGAALALAAVLLAVAAAARFIRRGLPPAQGAIMLRGSLALSPRHRLHLVEASGTRALVLTGGQGETIMVLPRIETPT